MAEAHRRLRSIIATLESCHADLSEVAERDSVQLLEIAILQLRMKLHHIGDAELKALCDAMSPEDAKDPGVPKTSNG